MDITKRLERMQGEVYEAHGVDSRPWGALDAVMILEVAHRVITEGLAPMITPDALEELTEENAHLARTGAELALSLLSRYELGTGATDTF